MARVPVPWFAAVLTWVLPWGRAVAAGHSGSSGLVVGLLESRAQTPAQVSALSGAAGLRLALRPPNLCQRRCWWEVADAGQQRPGLAGTAAGTRLPIFWAQTIGESLL